MLLELEPQQKATQKIFTKISDVKNLINFFIANSFPMKNGDQEYFGIVQVYKYKTWCFFTQNQINEVQKSFSLFQSNCESDDMPNLGCHFSKKIALQNKIYFNLSIIYRLIDPDNYQKYPGNTLSLEYKNKHLSVFKKNFHLLNLAMDDKQEVFYNKKPKLSYKDSNKFRFPLFNCDFTKNLSTKKSFQDILLSLCPNLREKELKMMKKFVASNWISGKSSDSFEIDFFFLSFIKLIYDIYGGEVLSDLALSGSFIKIYKNKKFEYLNSCFLLENNLYLNLKELLINLKENNLSHSLILLEKWDLSDDFIIDFNKYLKVLNKVDIKFQIERYQSASYLFNLCSKEMTKLKTKNFLLENNNKPGLESKLANNKVGEFTLKMPKDYSTLIKWGAWLHNCSGNYEQIDYYKKVICIGLFKNNEIQYMISIKGGELSQFKGFKNSAPSQELFSLVTDSLKKQKLIDSNKNYSYKQCCVHT